MDARGATTTSRGPAADRRAAAPRLLHVFATFVAGGPQVRTVRLIEALGDEWRHAVLAMDGRYDARELLPAAAPVTLLDPLPRAGTLATVRRLRGVLRAARPDVLLTYNWGAIDAVLASRWGGARAVLHHEDGFRPDELGGFKRRRVLVRRWALRAVRGVVVPSHTLEAIARETWHLPAERVHRIPNGIDVEAFAAEDGDGLAVRAGLGIPAGAVVLGSVGHLRAEKCPARMVRALARTAAPPGGPPPHLVLLGDGPERAAVESEVERAGLGGRVHLVGHVEDPRAHYRAMDVFVLASDTEQMPVALLEAMAAGLPVVSTDVGDVRRMLPAEQGAWIVSLAGEATAAALARALGDAVRDGGRRSELGRANRERARAEFSFEKMLAAYRGLYRKALGASSG